MGIHVLLSGSTTWYIMYRTCGLYLYVSWGPQLLSPIPARREKMTMVMLTA